MEKSRYSRFFLGVYLLLILFSFSFSPVFADEVNLTADQIASQCIQDSEGIMILLQDSNFSILRVNDTISEAESIFEVQNASANKGRKADYSRALVLCEEIKNIQILAFQLRDEIKVLDDFYKSSSQGIDTLPIEEVFSEINKEMVNERYELVPALIEKAYSEIILAQSRASTLNVFYNATSRGFKRFFTERRKELTIGLFVLILIFIVFKKPVERASLRRDLRKIEIRKRSLKDMITKNQDLYFNKGKMSEESFTIKNKKLAELIRDVDRQISLLNEQLYA